MIILKKITIKNLMSVGNVPIELNLDTHKKNIIMGKNGTGKSTILIEALTFALFGKPYRNINMPQLVNSTNKKGMEVKLDFDVGGIEYQVRRGIGPKVFEIRKDGELLEEDASISDFQDHLENKILQMTLKTFKQIVVLGTAGFTPFMQLTGPKRREVIEDLLDIQLLSIMAAKNKERLQIVQSDIVQAEHNIALLTQKKEMLQRLQSESHAKIEADKQEQIDKIIDLTAKLAALQIDIAVTSNQINKLTNMLSDGMHQTKLPVLFNQRGQSQAKVADNQKLLTFFQNNHNCPVCTQQIDTTFRDKKVFELDMDTDEANLRLDETQAMINDLESHRMRDQKINAKIQELKQKRSVDENTAKHFATAIETAKTKVAELETKEFKDQTDSLQKLELMLGKQSSHRLDLLNDKYCYSVITSILKDSGVKTVIIGQYIPVINKLIGDYLTKMGAMYNFELDAEFNETVPTRGMENFTYNSFSQGQKYRIDIAILFAWRELVKMISGSSVNLLVLDEVMDGSSDTDGIEALVDILNVIKEPVYVISHSEKIDAMDFDRTIQVKMTGKFSEIEISV